MKYYKFLTADNKGEYSKFDFTEYLPKDGKPGKWLPKIKNIEICESGYHAFELEHILGWVNAQLFEVELRGVSIIGDAKTVAQQMRFVRKVDTWNDKTAILFSYYCACDVLPIFEKEYPNYHRQRAAIETSERYANSEVTDSELYAAMAASMAASWSVAWSAARAAARNALMAAARDAELSAARDASMAASMAASIAAAIAAARVKYTAHLIEMLGLEER